MNHSQESTTPAAPSGTAPQPHRPGPPREPVVRPLPSELQSLLAGAHLGAAPCWPTLPSSLASLPLTDARRVCAEERLRLFEAAFEDGEGRANDALYSVTCAALVLLTGHPGIHLLREEALRMAVPDEHGLTVLDAYCAEVGAASIDDLTASQRWEALAWIYECNGFIEFEFDPERRAMGLPAWIRQDDDSPAGRDSADDPETVLRNGGASK